MSRSTELSAYNILMDLELVAKLDMGLKSPLVLQVYHPAREESGSSRSSAGQFYICLLISADNTCPTHGLLTPIQCPLQRSGSRRWLHERLLICLQRDTMGLLPPTKSISYYICRLRQIFRREPRREHLHPLLTTCVRTFLGNHFGEANRASTAEMSNNNWATWGGGMPQDLVRITSMLEVSRSPNA